MPADTESVRRRCPGEKGIICLALSFGASPQQLPWVGKGREAADVGDGLCGL